MADATLDDFIRIRDRAVEKFITAPRNAEHFFRKERDSHWARTERLINESVNALRVAVERGMPLGTKEQFTKSILALILPWGLRWFGEFVLREILSYLFKLWTERSSNGT